jgi:hypothetical protein
MNLFNLISIIHWIPVIVMTIFSFALGAIWHSSLLFGETWTKENNPEKAQLKINAPYIFGGTAIAHFMAITGLDAVTAGQGGLNGLATGFLISFIWIVPAMTATYLFANRSKKLLAIDAGMYVVLFSLTGFIMGTW